MKPTLSIHSMFPVSTENNSHKMVESKNKLLYRLCWSTHLKPDVIHVWLTVVFVLKHISAMIIWVSNQHNIPWTCPAGGWGDCLWIIPASAVGFSCFLITVQLATHNVHLYMGYSSCLKAAVQDTLCSFGNKTNRCEALGVAWKFILLLNAFNKVMASMCSDGLTLRCCLYVCTTLITSVVFVYFPLWIRFWQWWCIIAFYFMRGSWFNMMRKKKWPYSQISCSGGWGNWSSREQTPVPPTSCFTYVLSPSTCRWHSAPRFHLR